MNTGLTDLLATTAIDLTDARPRVALEPTIDQDTKDGLWAAYVEAFGPLREKALLTHQYSRAEFDELMDDERVYKLVARCKGRPIGLGVITNHLELAPQISPEFLRSRYPDLAERNAIYFGIMIFVSAERRRQILFAQLAGAMGQLAALDNGLLVFDICEYNRENLRLDSQLEHVAKWFPESNFTKIDTQSYYAARVPVPAERLPFGLDHLLGRQRATSA